MGSMLATMACCRRASGQSPQRSRQGLGGRPDASGFPLLPIGLKRVRVDGRRVLAGAPLTLVLGRNCVAILARARSDDPTAGRGHRSRPHGRHPHCPVGPARPGDRLVACASRAAATGRPSSTGRPTQRRTRLRAARCLVHGVALGRPRRSPEYVGRLRPDAPDLAQAIEGIEAAPHEHAMGKGDDSAQRTAQLR